MQWKAAICHANTMLSTFLAMLFSLFPMLSMLHSTSLLHRDEAGRNRRSDRPRWSGQHLVLHFGEALYCEIKIRDSMACAYLSTDPRFAFRDNRISEADYVHAFFEHTPGKFGGYAVIVKHHGHYRMLTRKKVKTGTLHLFAEIICVSMNLIPQLPDRKSVV
mgnify:FL=1